MIIMIIIPSVFSVVLNNILLVCRHHDVPQTIIILAPSAPAWSCRTAHPEKNLIEKTEKRGGKKSQRIAHMKSAGVYQISRSLTDSCIETTDAAITISIKRVQKHLQTERSSVTPFILGEQKAAVGAAAL